MLRKSSFSVPTRRAGKCTHTLAPLPRSPLKNASPHRQLSRVSSRVFHVVLRVQKNCYGCRAASTLTQQSHAPLSQWARIRRASTCPEAPRCAAVPRASRHAPSPASRSRGWRCPQPRQAGRQGNCDPRAPLSQWARGAVGSWQLPQYETYAHAPPWQATLIKVTAFASVDAPWKTGTPQSHLVRARYDPNWSMRNGKHVVVGQ